MLLVAVLLFWPNITFTDFDQSSELLENKKGWLCSGARYCGAWGLIHRFIQIFA